jgi:hypothetical protein
VLERRRWNMVALAGDDHAIASGERGDVSAAVRELRRDDVEGLPHLEPLAAGRAGRRGGHR